MKRLERALAGLLCVLTVAFSPGLTFYQAAAQVVPGAAPSRAAVPVVPSLGAGVAGLAPLASGAAAPMPAAPAALPSPLLLAPAPGATAALAPGAIAPVSKAGRLAGRSPAVPTFDGVIGKVGLAGATGAAGLAGRSPAVSALDGAMGAAGLAGWSPAVSALDGAMGAAGLAAATALPGTAAPDGANPAADARSQLAVAGDKLAGASEAGKPGILEAVFLGGRAAVPQDDSDATPVPRPEEPAAPGHAGLDRPEGDPAARSPAAPPAGAPSDGPVQVPRALWGMLLGDVVMTIGMYMHILSQPFLIQGLTGSSAAVGLVRNIHYGSYTASSFFSLGSVVDKTDYRVLMTGSYVLRALLMGAIPLLFMTGHLTLAALSVIVAINPFFQNISTTTDESAQISILGTDERVILKGKALVTKVLALANFLPLVSGLIVGSLVAAFGATAGYAYAYAGYAAFLLLAVPFLQILLTDPRHGDPNVKEKPSRNWLNLLIPLAAVFQTLSLAGGITQTLRYLGARFLAPGQGPARNILAGAVLALTSPLWLVGGALLVQARRIASAYRAAARFVRSLAQARGGKAAEPVGARERAARALERSEATQGVSFILRNNVLWLLALVGTTNLFLADALDFVVMPNFISQVIVPRLDLAHLPVVGGLLSTGAGVFTLLLIAGSAASLWVTRLFDGDDGIERIKRWGHKKLYRVAALGSASFFLLLIPAFLLAPDAGMRAVLEEGYRLLEDPGTKAAGEQLIRGVLDSIPLWKFGANLGITMLVQFLTSLLQVPLLLAMAPVRNKQIPPEKVGSIITAFTIIEVILMGLGSLVLGFVVDAVTIQAGMLVVMGVVGASALLEWLVPKWLAREKPEGWYAGAPAKPKGD